MGGTHGEVRGRSKIEAYLNYVELIEGFGAVFNDHFPDAKRKKACKNLMTLDPESGEWILRYHFHT
jgi:hypothetical protein